MFLRFGAFELDERRFELRQDGRVVAVQPQVLEVIRYLARNPDRLVTRDELLRAAWGGVSVGDAAISRAIKEARRVLGDDARRPNVIETVRGRGFRFKLGVSWVEGDPGPDGRRMSLASAPAQEWSRPGRACTADDRPFIGRAEELAVLAANVADALAGSGRLVFVTGVPGVGKSRLVEEFATCVTAAGGEVVWGQCRGAPGAPALWPWSEVVRAYLERRAPESLAELVDASWPELVALVPELRRSAPEPVAPLGDAPRDCFRIIDAVSRLFRRGAQRAPLVIVLEDVHLAQDAALLLLDFMRRTLLESSLVLVATCREPEGNEREPLRAMLDARSPAVQTIRLGGLGHDDVAEWLASAGTLLPPEAIALICRETDGHPLLIEEMLQALPARWRGDVVPPKHARRPLPEHLVGGLRARLYALPEATTSALGAASVVGKEFSLALVAEVIGSTLPVLMDRLEPARTAMLVEHTAGDRFSFAHVLVRDTIYYDLPLPERCARHAAVARCLDARRAAMPELAAQSAQHWLAAIPYVEAHRAVERTMTSAPPLERGLGETRANPAGSRMVRFFPTRSSTLA